VTRALAVVLSIVLLATVACGADNGPPTPEEQLQAIAQRYSESPYRLSLGSGTIPLEEWGIVSGGSVTVDGAGNVYASLRRASDGTYKMYRFHPDSGLPSAGATLFARETCTQFARVPGGGAGVLAGFILGEELAAATDVSEALATSGFTERGLSAPPGESPPDPPDLRARLPHLGEVRLIVDQPSEVNRIIGGGFVLGIDDLTFEEMPVPPEEPILAELGDREPGGVPC
jgi:hypothetical protein